jgi:hypothetical protein
MWIDYCSLRRQIPMEQVLDLLGYRAMSRRGPQLRGPCPLLASVPSDRRSFSIHLTKGVFYCFHCRAHGNQLDLWAQIHQLPSTPPQSTSAIAPKSAFRSSTRILRPDSWLPLDRETGSL